MMRWIGLQVRYTFFHSENKPGFPGNKIILEHKRRHIVIRYADKSLYRGALRRKISTTES